MTSQSNEKAIATFRTKGVIKISIGPTCSMYVNPTRTEANTSCYCDVDTESETKPDQQVRETPLHNSLELLNHANMASKTIL